MNEPLLEDTQNIVLTEDQILLVVYVNTVSTESRNKHTINKKQ